MKFLNSIDLRGALRFTNVVDVGIGNTSGLPVNVSNANYVILSPWSADTRIYTFTNAVLGQFLIVENDYPEVSALVTNCNSGTIPVNSARAMYCYVISLGTPYFKFI